jgi:hypothetical protein
MWSVSAHDNCLPFSNLCPCVSATILGNDAAVFHTDAHLGPFSEEMLYKTTLPRYILRNYTNCYLPKQWPLSKSFSNTLHVIGKEKDRILDLWHCVENKTEIKQHDLKMQ